MESIAVHRLTCPETRLNNFRDNWMKGRGVAGRSVNHPLKSGVEVKEKVRTISVLPLWPS